MSTHEHTSAPEPTPTPSPSLGLVDRLVRVDRAVILLGLAVAVVVSVVTVSIPTEDANLGLVNGFLIGVPLLPPLALVVAADLTARRWPRLALGLAVAATAILALGALFITSVYLPTLA